MATVVEVVDQLGRRLDYRLQQVAAPNYRGFRPTFPEPLRGPIEHPDRKVKSSHEATAHRRTRRRMTTAEMKHFFRGGR